MKIHKHLRGLGSFCKRHHQHLVGTLITFSVALGVVGLRGIGSFEQIELKTYDYLLRSRSPEPPDKRVAIVEISEDDIQRKGAWPWSDQMFADLISRIAAAKPAAIGIDKYFDIPVGDASTREKGRQSLIAAMKSAGNVVNVTYVSVKEGARGVNLPEDLAKVSGAGFANIPTDEGSIVRRAQIAGDYGSLALELASIFLEKTPDKQIKFDPSKKQFSAGNQVIPRITDNYGGYRHEGSGGYETLINFRGKERSFEHISAVDVLDGKVNPDRLRDRVILVGITSIAQKDSFPTPFSTGKEELMYGVEVHANIVSQLLSAALDGRPFLRALPNDAESLWIVFWTLVGGTLATYVLNVGKNLTVLIVMAAGLSGAVYWAFLQALWLPFFPAFLGLLTANILVIAYQLAIQQSERKVLMGIFSRHVSKELVNIIWENREKFLQEGRITGQEVYVTVLFTDMRNFSSAAEAQKPGETLDWLNEYLGAIANEVLAHGGMVDKYIGDAVMAVFGVPIPHGSEVERDRDAQNAVAAAIAIAQKVIKMSNDWVEQGIPPVVTGIGINSGIVIAGSLGSAERLEYSVLGDTVNVASRLESFNKEVDGGEYHILISEDTHKRLDNKFKTEFVCNYALKGRQKETEIHRVVGFNQGQEDTKS
ncbi:adenylate/guanylate cyclase domain-containing protein [Tumidithrix elongata RA019]|uniref:Adenylate/guanylate cyclase domain-containing protein n=1 Tax=Tumidithrix elongata BACA0141 TaxID=2716417 RepID=A0AAW9PZD8_9CYAN|nr:adenylate/guanylate cyclase domain-containing protein [Tumidithrix elongata RA019]